MVNEIFNLWGFPEFSDPQIPVGRLVRNRAITKMPTARMMTSNIVMATEITRNMYIYIYICSLHIYIYVIYICFIYIYIYVSMLYIYICYIYIYIHMLYIYIHMLYIYIYMLYIHKWIPIPNPLGPSNLNLIMSGPNPTVRVLQIQTWWDSGQTGWIKGHTLMKPSLAMGNVLNNYITIT